MNFLTMKISTTTTLDNHSVTPVEFGYRLAPGYDNAIRQTSMQDGPTLVTHSYDAKGNFTVENRGGVISNFAYDQDNKMVGILHLDSSLSTYTYGADGLRRLVHEPIQTLATVIFCLPCEKSRRKLIVNRISL